MSGGWVDDWNFSDSIEVYDPSVGLWTVASAKLPRPMDGLRAINIDDRILIFGNYI